MTDSPDSRTLLIKHLPAECSGDECRQLLTSLGASTVTFMGHTGPLKHCAFAEFVSTEHAWKIIEGLHQKSIFGKRISVEFLSNDLRRSIIQVRDETPLNSEVGKQVSSTQAPGSSLSEFAPLWDRSLHVSSTLSYQYPPPTDKILTNIVRALVSCSALYTQVLHLMNRMHLPPPFDDPDLFPGTYFVISDKELIKSNHAWDESDLKGPFLDSTKENIEAQEMDLSSGPESELDSDETEKVQPKRNIQRRKRIRSNLPITRLTSTSMGRFGKSSSTEKKVTEFNDLFEPVSKPKRPNLQIAQTIKLNEHSQEISEMPSTEGGFGIIEPRSETVDKECPMEDFDFGKGSLRISKSPPCLNQHNSSPPPGNTTNPIDQSLDIDTITTFSLNELKQGCLNPENRSNYAVFSRGYDPGEPTSRLYIKNLAALVQEVDLFQVYGLFANGLVLDPDEKLQIRPESSLRFSIRLLTEGRMKGQAFISLPCESTAKQALEVTNGFMLFDKPIVVQFARGAKAKVDDKSLILSQPEI